MTAAASFSRCALAWLAAAVLVFGSAGFAAPAHAAATDAASKGAKKANSAKPAKAKKAAKPKAAQTKAAQTKAAKAGPRKPRDASKAKASKPKPQRCSVTVLRNGRKQTVKRPCAQAEEPLIRNSPIHAKALQESGTPLETSPVKARSAPIRAYAVDGSSFYHNGRRYQVEGLGPETGLGLPNEHAAHKLQRILDSGNLALEPVAADDTGAMRARVRVDGQDVAERFKQSP